MADTYQEVLVYIIPIDSLNPYSREILTDEDIKYREVKQLAWCHSASKWQSLSLVRFRCADMGKGMPGGGTSTSSVALGLVPGVSHPPRHQPSFLSEPRWALWRAGCRSAGGLGWRYSGVVPQGWQCAQGGQHFRPHSVVKTYCEFLLKGSSRFSTTSPVLYGMNCDKL